jgi:transposase
MRYELTDYEWATIKPFLPNKPRGVPRVNDRRVLNGIFWVLRSGAPWRDLPESFGTYTTCYNRPGRVMRQVRRCFVAAGAKPLCVGDLLPWIYPRLDRFKHWHRWSARRALLRYAVPLGRSDKRGRPVMAMCHDKASSKAVMFAERDLVRLLRAAVKREGGQTAFAKRHGINRSRVNSILTGKRRPGDAVAKALGLRKVYVAE